MARTATTGRRSTPRRPPLDERVSCVCSLRAPSTTGRSLPWACWRCRCESGKRSDRRELARRFVCNGVRVTPLHRGNPGRGYTHQTVSSTPRRCSGRGRASSCRTAPYDPRSHSRARRPPARKAPSDNRPWRAARTGAAHPVADASARKRLGARSTHRLANGQKAACAAVETALASIKERGSN